MSTPSPELPETSARWITNAIQRETPTATASHPRRTKIVCTLGPSTTEPDAILELVHAGMDCARLNFSHGTHDEHAARIAAVRSAEEKLGRPIALLADLCGPKIRVAKTFEPRAVAAGDRVILTGADASTGEAVPITFPDLADAVAPGQPVLIEDGRIHMLAVERRGSDLVCKVEVGGTVKPGKGVNIPQSEIPIPSRRARSRSRPSRRRTARTSRSPSRRASITSRYRSSSAPPTSSS